MMISLERYRSLKRRKLLSSLRRPVLRRDLFFDLSRFLFVSFSAVLSVRDVAFRRITSLLLSILRSLTPANLKRTRRC